MQLTTTARRGLPAACALSVLAAAAGATAVTAKTPPAYDAIIRGGTVLDGSGAPGRVADVGIRNGYIHRIGDLEGVSARREYDARRLYVTPGFIDPHAHTETGKPLAAAKSALTQGVTTETLGADGGGQFKIAKQLSQLRGRPKGINVAPYVGFNRVWEDVVGEADVRPTAAQRAAMRARIRQAMREGAWSVSSGLGYTPAKYARTDEVVDAVKAAGPWRAMFTDHIRDEMNYVLEATNEVINIGRSSGLMPEVTHIKIGGPANWGESSSQLRMLAGARASGAPAGADVYPYTAAQTGMTFYVPTWAQDGGTAAMLARFADPATRERIDKEITTYVIEDVGAPEHIDFPTLGNKSLQDFMDQYGGVSVGEAVMRLLEAHGGQIEGVMHIGSEKDLKNFMRAPFVAFSSDGGVTDSAEIHPRAYGTFPRVLGRYVREQRVISWPEAIRKMTGLTASMIGMVDRGYLADGMVADVTVFDPKTIIDKATFEQPRQYAEGVKWVFVNGKLALENGESTNAHSGQALRRASSMPTRPQSVGRNLTAKAAGVVGGVRLKVALKHRAGAPAAAGTVTASGRGWRLRSARLGRLQTADGWFSVTGIGRLANGKEKAFLVTVDKHDPLARAGQTRATIRIAGVGETRGALRTAARRR